MIFISKMENLTVDQHFNTQAWVTILIYSIAPPHWNLCELWPKKLARQGKISYFLAIFHESNTVLPFFPQI